MADTNGKEIYLKSIIYNTQYINIIQEVEKNWIATQLLFTRHGSSTYIYMVFTLLKIEPQKGYVLPPGRENDI